MARLSCTDPDVDDARVTGLWPSPTLAAKVYRRTAEVRTDHLDDVLAGWSDRDRKQLSVLVNRLVDQFKVVPVGGPGSVKEPPHDPAPDRLRRVGPRRA